MADTAAALVIQLSADIKQFRTEMQKAVGINDKASRDIIRKHQQMKRELIENMRGAAAGVNGALGAIGIGIGVAEFAHLIHGVTDTAEALEHLSQRTGLSTDALQELQYGAKKSGVSTEQFGESLDKLLIRLGQAQQHSGPLVKVLEQYHLTGKSAQDTLLGLADAVSHAADVTEKYRIVQAAFGKGSAEMVNFLNQGADGIRRLSGEAHDLGQVLDKDAIKKLADLKIKLDELQTSFVNLSGPALGQVAKGIATILDNFRRGGFEQGMLSLAGVLTSMFEKGFTGNPLHDAVTSDILEVQRLQNELAQLRTNSPNPFTANAIAAKAHELQAAQAQLSADIGNDTSGAGQHIGRGHHGTRSDTPLAPGTVPTPAPDGQKAADAAARLARENKIALDRLVADRQTANSEVQLSEDRLNVELAAGTSAEYDLKRKLIADETAAKIAAIDDQEKAEIDAIDRKKVRDQADYDHRVQLIHDAAAARRAAAAGSQRLEESQLNRSSQPAGFLEFTDSIGKSAARATELTSELRSGLENVGEAGLGGFKSMRSAAGQFVEQLAAMILKLYVLEPLLNSVFKGAGSGGAYDLSGLVGQNKSGGNGFGAFLGGVVSSIFGGFHADGGTIAAGKVGVVGERGPELAYGGAGGLRIQPITTPTIPRVAPRSAAGAHTINMRMSIDLAGAKGDKEIQAMVRAGAQSSFDASVSQFRKEFPTLMVKAQRDHL